MTEQQPKDRTKASARRVLRRIDAMPESRSGRVLAGQSGRSGTSVGADYRAACRSRSSAEMIPRLSVVEEEADESVDWLELAADHGIMPRGQLGALMQEADELAAIMVASRRTLRANDRKSRIQNRK